jgi:hypothetical protein
MPEFGLFYALISDFDNGDAVVKIPVLLPSVQKCSLSVRLY